MAGVRAERIGCVGSSVSLGLCGGLQEKNGQSTAVQATLAGTAIRHAFFQQPRGEAALMCGGMGDRERRDAHSVCEGCRHQCHDVKR